MVVPSQTYAHMQNIWAHNLYVFLCSSTWIANIHVNVGSEWGSRSTKYFFQEGGSDQKKLVQFIIFPDAINSGNIIQNKLIPWKGDEKVKCIPHPSLVANPNTRQLDRVTGRISIQNTSLCPDDVLATVFSIGISIHDGQLQGRSIENPRRSSHTIAAPSFLGNNPEKF